LKLKLQRDVELAFAAGKKYFEGKSDIVSSGLFNYAHSLAEQCGWEFGGPIAGHLIGEFPHERIPGDKVSLYVHPESQLSMRSLDEKGQKRHWILEIHFIDRQQQFGGFYEELLTVG
jgi:Xaa-Pro dipeptidase